MVNFQLETLKKRALKFEQQLVEATERHEEELKEKELLCDKQKKELLKERKRNKELEEELRVYEDSVVNGTAVPKETMLRKSPDSSPEVPNPKRARVDLIEDTSPPLNQMDKATNKLADKTKALKAQFEQKRAYIKRIEDISVDPVRAAKTPDRGEELKERVRRYMEDDWNSKADDGITSAYLQSRRDNANMFVATKDAR